MKPISEYHDYRRYMMDFYEERKRTSAFTWRVFAELAGFVSPSYLKLVCDGKTCLSKPGVPKVARAMGLAGFDLTYFTLLVRFGNAKTDEAKKEAFDELQREARANRVRIIEADAFRYYESSLCPILRELAPLMPLAYPNEMAAKIKHPVAAFDVRNALQFMVQAGLLTRRADGSYEQTEKAVKGSKEAIPLAIRSMNAEMAELAKQSIENVEPERRNISGVTMGIDDEAFARITREVDECRRRVVAIANESRHINQVYRLNFQLFPLTDKVIIERKRGKKVRRGGSK